ncbi:hypothetical protein [Thalassospira sp.]|uniref:hypothetical protein n=1 Tax=Thalassospira sp. TaxID=1912094 RepID=UPI003AA8B86C
MSPTEIPLASDNNSHKQPEFQMQTIITHIRNYFFQPSLSLTPAATRHAIREKQFHHREAVVGKGFPMVLSITKITQNASELLSLYETSAWIGSNAAKRSQREVTINTHIKIQVTEEGVG